MPFLPSSFQMYPVRYIKFRRTSDLKRPFRAENQILLYNSYPVLKGVRLKKTLALKLNFSPTSCTLTIHSRTSGLDFASSPFRTKQTKQWRGNGFGQFQYFSSISGESKSSAVKCEAAIKMRYFWFSRRSISLMASSSLFVFGFTVSFFGRSRTYPKSFSVVFCGLL